MAGGTIDGGATYGNFARITWSSSVVNGGSTVSAQLWWVPNGRYNFTYRNGYSLSIHTSGISGSGAVQNGSSATQLLSHSFTIGYTGTVQIGLNGSVDLRTVTSVSHGTKLPIYTVGALVTLDNVGYPPSVSTITAPTNQTISETTDTITVKWNSGTSYNGTGTYHVDVSINGGAYTWVSGEIPWGTTQWTYTIPDKKPGTTYRFRIDTGNNIGWSGHSYSGVVKINEVACGDITVPATFNPYTATQSGSNAVLPVKFTAGSQATSGTLYNCAQLYYNDALVSSTVFKSSANGLTVNVNIPPATYIAKLGITKYQGTFTIKGWCENQNGTKSVVKQATFKVDINTDGKAAPTLSVPTTSGGVLDNPETCFIAGITDITVTVPNATANRAPSGTKLSYEVTIEETNSTYTSQTCTFTNLSSGIKTIKVTVTDSRGLKASKSIKRMVQGWTKPSLTVSSCKRNDDDGTKAVLVMTASYSPIYQYQSVTNRGNQLNTISVQQYRLNAGTWTDATNNMEITGLDTEQSYNLTVRVADKVSPTTYTTDSVTIPTVKSLLSIRPWGAGIMCIPARNYALDVVGSVRITNGVLAMTKGGGTYNVIDLGDGDSTGLGVKFGGYGGTLIGSGESPQLFSVGSSEYMYITSDGQINFYTGCNGGLSGAHRTYISAAGNLYCDSSILTSGYIEVGTTMIVGTNTDNPTSYASRSLQVGAPNYRGRLNVYGDIYGGDVKNPRKVAYQDELPKFYVLNGTHIVNFANSNGALLHTWTQIQEMFQAAYGFTPTKRTALSVTAMNGDTNTTQLHIDGTCWYPGDSSRGSGDVHVLTDQNHNGSVRINYGYVYCEAGGEIE